MTKLEQDVMEVTESLRPKGTLTVITGSMFGGKSLDLIEEIKSWEFSGFDYLAFSPIKPFITSRGSNYEVPAIEVEASHSALISYIVGSEIQNGMNIERIAIDEVSFYDAGIVSVIEILLSEGIDVVVAGLDQDFRGKPFGSIGDLMALATEVTKRYSICMKCRVKPGTKTQRLLNGEPAPFEGDLIVVEHTIKSYTYECRCKDCHERG